MSALSLREPMCCDRYVKRGGLDFSIEYAFALLPLWTNRGLVWLTPVWHVRQRRYWTMI